MCLRTFARIVWVFVHIYNVIMSPFGAQRLLFDLFIKKRTEDPKTDGMYIILHL